MTVICIGGMHRCGTSLVARVLNLLGVDLGPEDRMMRPKEENARGFWENQDLVRISQRILQAFDGDWDAPPALPPGWQTDRRLEALRRAARALLEETFADAGSEEGLVGWKDPRLSLTLPFWREVVEVGTFVVCLRDPRAVAASLERRNGFDGERSARLWLRYVAHASHVTVPQAVVFYEDFFDDLTGTVAALAADAGLGEPGDAAMEAIGAFFSPELRRADPGRTPAGPWMSDAVEVAEALRSRQRPPPVLERLHGPALRAAPALSELQAARRETDERVDELGDLRRRLRRSERDRDVLQEEVERLRRERERLRADHRERIGAVTAERDQARRDERVQSAIADSLRREQQRQRRRIRQLEAEVARLSTPGSEQSRGAARP